MPVITEGSGINLCFTPFLCYLHCMASQVVLICICMRFTCSIICKLVIKVMKLIHILCSIKMFVILIALL